MMTDKEKKGEDRRKGRHLAQLLLLVSAVMVTAGAIPFVYESQTLWYKIGIDRTLLQVGQLFGLLVFLGLCLQILLGTRGKLLEEILGMAPLMKWHRANGIVLCAIAALHVFFVLLPEGMANLPLGTKFWPETVGAALLLVLFLQTATSLARQRLNVPYQSWRIIHMLTAWLMLLLAAVHVLFGADSFGQGVPRVFLLVVTGSVIVRVFFVKLQRSIGKNK